MKMSILSHARSISFIAVLLLVTAHRLPAPIEEMQESPTPTPAPEEEAAESKPKRSPKPKKKTEDEGTPAKKQTESTTSSSKTQTTQSPFAGTWVGTFKQGMWGDVETTLVINETGTSVAEKNRYRTSTHPATPEGKTLKFHSGTLNAANWTFTPNADGKTAGITCNSPFIGSQSATFQKRSSSTVPSFASASTAPSAVTGVPTAKPVPDKPGFVYDPFDPNSKMLLDVRGKPSGAKVKDPSGRLFVIP